MKKTQNILIINAHQFYPSSEGKLNQSLVDLAKELLEEEGHQLKLTKIDDGYQIGDEVEKHEWADLIITQMPVYWFGGPWPYKKYIDEVMNELIGRRNLALSDGRSRYHDKPYGSGGLDHGKKFLLSTTWNAPKIAFDDQEQYLFAGLSQDDAMIGITSVYKFMGFEILPGFACYDVKKAPQIEEDFKRYKDKLANIFN
jgi:modulator of drug activity B